ncbi:MAG: helix-hairpin-helix domain-containing protein [Planctomycetota bacterium]|jgi:hypothetical protein
MQLVHLQALLVASLASQVVAVQTPPVPVVFMEPAEDGGSSAYVEITDAERVGTYRKWLDNESAHHALRLYALAHEVVGAVAADEPYHVAIVPNGNHAAAGFRLVTEDGTVDHPRRPYIKLDPSPAAFENTFLHESGHVVLGVLAAGRGIPAEPVASIPHTTFALTDRSTAFNEGFAIFLEALAAHLSADPRMRATYRHERMIFGSDDFRASDYYFRVIDLRNYAQTRARYQEVRDNSFAFESACREPDYLRVQLDPARDFARLRDANQLLQSEGFYASYFLALTVHGPALPDEATIAERQRRIVRTLADVLQNEAVSPSTPFLVDFVESWLTRFPEHGAEAVDVLLDLSHGVFVDADAARLWGEAYRAALQLDIQRFPPPELPAARAAWRSAVLDDPAVLRQRLGPQLSCEVADVSVLLVYFGRAAPLSFDLNTVQEGIARMVPGIDAAAVDRWMAERAARPFADAADFRQRVVRDEPWGVALRIAG